MRTLSADLLSDVTATYDQTKTTIQGRVYQKTFGGKTVLGPPTNKFVDVIVEAGVTPNAQGVVITQNGRVFALSAEASGIITVALYTIDFTTGGATYVGKLAFRVGDTPSTTHTYRAVKCYDTGATGWKLYLTTSASQTFNGGTYLVNNIGISDFVQVGFATIPFATGDDQKAVYLLQDPSNIGVGQLQTSSNGAVLDYAAQRLYVHNGTAALHQYYVYDVSAAPLWAGASVTGDQATDVISHAGHTFQLNDPVVLYDLVGGAGLVGGATYFARTIVPGVSYQLSATVGGAAVNFTTNIISATAGRAHGTTGSCFLHKTGDLPPLTGTILSTDSQDYAEPQHVGGALAGQPCAFLSTNSTLYLGLLSELTSGATTWPSLISANLLGTPNQIITPAATVATWSTKIDRAIYATSNSMFVMKKFINNQIERVFGGADNIYLEGLSTEIVPLLPISAPNVLDIEDGWMTISTATAGQRGGVWAADLWSDAMFDNSFIVTKVLNTPDAVFKFLAATSPLYRQTGSLKIYYRTSGFGVITGGWTEVPYLEDVSASIPTSPQIQFKIMFDTLRAGSTQVPAQLSEFYIGYTSRFDISEHWEASYDASSSAVPTRFGFRLKKAYASSVPQLFFRGFDTTVPTASQVLTLDSVGNSANFEYSTDDLVSWNPLGVIPNVVGTYIRITPTTPPGVKVRAALSEE